jgi:hypothetical protein
LVDLLRPYLDGVDRVVDRTPASLDLRRHLLLPEGVAYDRSEAGPDGLEAAGPETLVLVALGPDAKVHGDPSVFGATLRGLGPGGRAAVLFGWDAAVLPYHRLLDPLTTGQVQVLQLAKLDDGHVPSIAVIERVDRLIPPRDATGRPIVPEPADDAGRLALGIRLANEYAFGGFVAQAWRTAGPIADESADVRFAFEERTRLRRQLGERDATILKLKTQLGRVERSTSLRLGQILVGAAKSPRAALRLPADLYRIWRKRPS